MKRREFLQATGFAAAATAVVKPAIAQSAPEVRWRYSVTFNGLGLGLGLTVVRELVAEHGGSVVASSAGAGLGSTFGGSLS